VAAGTRDPVRALAVAGPVLYAVVGDAPGQTYLGCREACGQNLPWRPAGEHRADEHGADEQGPSGGIVALAVPRDAVAGAPAGLYALHRDGVVLARPATPGAAAWSEMGKGPPGGISMAAAGDHFFVLDGQGGIWSCPQGQLQVSSWHKIGQHGGLIALTGMNGRLFAADRAGRLLTRTPAPGGTWRPAGGAGGCTVLAGRSGVLYGASPGRPLSRMELPGPPGTAIASRLVST
jgi:hypothetical protein